MSGIQGLERLLASLDDLEANALEGVARGMEKGLARIGALAKTLAPVRTGALRDSIGHTVARRAGEVEGTVGAGAKYAAAVEFGGPQAPHPFLYPAFAQTRERISSDIKDEVQRRLGGK